MLLIRRSHEQRSDDDLERRMLLSSERESKASVTTRRRCHSTTECEKQKFSPLSAAFGTVAGRHSIAVPEEAKKRPGGAPSMSKDDSFIHLLDRNSAMPKIDRKLHSSPESDEIPRRKLPWGNQQIRVITPPSDPEGRRSTFDRRAAFALTKPRRAAAEDKTCTAERARDVVQHAHARRHSWASSLDFSQVARGSDLFTKFGWESSETGGSKDKTQSRQRSGEDNDRFKALRRYSSDKFDFCDENKYFHRKPEREKIQEVFEAAQKSKVDKIAELQDENKALKSKNEALAAEVSEAQEKAVDFVLAILKPKDLSGLAQLNDVKDQLTKSKLEAASPRRGKKGSLEKINSVISMMYQSGMVSNGKFDSTSDLRERCRDLRRDRNMHYHEALKAQREVKVLTTEVEGLQRNLIEALEDAKQVEAYKSEVDQLKNQLDSTVEELHRVDSTLREKSERLALVEEELRLLKDMGAMSFHSAFSGIDVPSYGTSSYGTPSMCSTEVSESVTADDEASRGRRMEEIIHEKDVALLSAHANMKAKIDDMLQLEKELDAARQDIAAARAAAGTYRAEMEDEIQSAQAEAEAKLQEARREVLKLKDELDERNTTITKLELEVATAVEDVEDLKEELRLAKEMNGKGLQVFQGDTDDDLLSTLVKVQIENQQLREKLGVEG